MKISQILLKVAQKLSYVRQTFGDSSGEYSVAKLVEYAVKNLPITQIPINYVQHSLEEGSFDEPIDSKEFAERAYKAEDYPILVLKLNNRYHIIDGFHRTWKWLQQKKEKIPAYIFNGKKAIQFAKITGTPE